MLLCNTDLSSVLFAFRRDSEWQVWRQAEPFPSGGETWRLLLGQLQLITQPDGGNGLGVFARWHLSHTRGLPPYLNGEICNWLEDRSAVLLQSPRRRSVYSSPACHSLPWADLKSGASFFLTYFFNHWCWEACSTFFLLFFFRNAGACEDVLYNSSQRHGGRQNV